MRTDNLIYAFPQNHSAPRRVRSKRTMLTDRCYAVCCAVFLLGVLLGAVSIVISKGTLLSYIVYVTKTDLMQRAELPFWQAFVQTAAPKLGVLLVLRLLSGCIYGAAASGLLFLLYGACAGIISGCTYSILGVKAIGFNALILLPPAMIATIATLIYGAKALQTAWMLYDSIRLGSTARFKEAFDHNRRTLLVATAAVLVAAVLETLLFRGFGGRYF